MPVPNTFANATSAIPLSQLDNNFATAITLGNTAIQLGNTVTTLNNMTLANVTISSVSTPITAAQGGTGLTAVGNSGNVLTSNGTTWISQAPAAVTGNVTIGNTTINLGGTATTVGNLTLTNATISSLSTPVTVAQGGTGATTLTANNVILGNGTAAVQFVAPGFSGNVLSSNGTTWASTAPVGSTMVWLYQATAFGASTVDLTGIDNTYDVIWITAVGVYFGTSTARLLMQVESGGSYQNTLYSYSSWATPSPNTTFSGFAASTTSEIRVTENSYIGSSSSDPGSFDLTCYTPGSTTAQKTFTLKASVGSGSAVYPVFGAAKWKSTGAITAIRFLPNTGVIYGTFRMYGIKNS